MRGSRVIESAFETKLKSTRKRRQPFQANQENAPNVFPVTAQRGELVSLKIVVQPRRERATPSANPELTYVGLEHVESHSTKLLGSVPATNMRSTSNKYYVGDVLYSRLRPYLNKVWMADRNGLCSSEFIVLPGNETIDSGFLRYRLNTSDFVRFASSLNAGDRPRVDFEEISAFKFQLFPLPKQKEIVAEIEEQFSRLDSGVAALRRVQANLKRYRAAVLKAACEGKLVPTEAQRVREGVVEADYETGNELLKRLLVERHLNWCGCGKYKEPAGIDTTKLSHLPEGWVWASIEQLSTAVETGATPLRSCSDYWINGTIPWITSGALNKESVESAKEYVTETAVAETNAKLFPPGTLLLAMYGEGLTRGKVSELKITAATNQACAAILFGEWNGYLKEYIRIYLLSNYNNMRLQSAGGVQPNLNLSTVKRTAIPLPPLAEQVRIVAEVERLMSVVLDLENAVCVNLSRSKRLRESVLTRAFCSSHVPLVGSDSPQESA